VGRYVANKDKPSQSSHASSRVKRVPDAILTHVTIQ